MSGKSSLLVYEPPDGFEQERNGKWCCDVCSHEEASKDDLRVHRIFHLYKEGSKYCPICRKTLAASYSLRDHLTAHTGVKKYRCKYCSRTFGWRNQLAVHLKTHTKTGLHHCLVCSKSFTTKYCLTKHMSVHKKTIPNAEEQSAAKLVNFCQKVVIGSSLMGNSETSTSKFKIRHKIKTNVSSKKRNVSPAHTCCVCTRSFKTRVELNTHMLEHDGTNQIGQTHCDDEYIRNSAPNGSFNDSADLNTSSMKFNEHLKESMKKTPNKPVDDHNLEHPVKSLTFIVSKLRHSVNESQNIDNNQIVVANVTKYREKGLNSTEERDGECMDIADSIDDKTNIRPVLMDSVNQEHTLILDPNNLTKTPEPNDIRLELTQQTNQIAMLKSELRTYIIQHQKETAALHSKIDSLTNLLNSQSLILHRILLGGKMNVHGTLDFYMEKDSK